MRWPLLRACWPCAPSSDDPLEPRHASPTALWRCSDGRYSAPGNGPNLCASIKACAGRALPSTKGAERTAPLALDTAMCWSWPTPTGKNASLWLFTRPVAPTSRTRWRWRKRRLRRTTRTRPASERRLNSLANRQGRSICATSGKHWQPGWDFRRSMRATASKPGATARTWTSPSASWPRKARSITSGTRRCHHRHWKPKRSTVAPTPTVRAHESSFALPTVRF